MKILVIGHSHVQSVCDALAADTDAWRRQGLDFETLQLREPRFAGDPGNDADGIGPVLRAEIARVAADCDASLLMIGGNAHNGLGLFEHEQPFDFVLDEAPDLPLDTRRTLVPSALVAAQLRQWHPFDVPHRQRQALLPLLPPAIGQTDSPPPLLDTEQTRVRLDDAQRHSERGRRGLCPPALRLKAWALHSRLLAQACAEAGLPFLPAPAAAFGPDGGLAPEAWGRDAIHANAWYGRRVLEQVLEKVLEQTLPQGPKQPPTRSSARDPVLEAH